MVTKPTNDELNDQIADLKKENNALRQKISFLNEHKNIREIENHSRTLLDHLGDAVFIKDEQSRIVIANEALCGMFRLSRKDVIGRTLAEYVTPEESESFLKIDKMVLETGIENINEETLSVNGGKSRTISTRKSRFIDSNGKKYIVGVVRDITLRKEAEKLIKESELKFRNLNSTKDKLFSILAHDLRSPFNNILGFTELLLSADDDITQASSRKMVEFIRETTQNAILLLENLLEWAKSQTGVFKINLENIQVSDVVDDAINFERLMAESKNISLHFSPDEEIECCTDQNILKTIIRNLISNAIKFTKPEGKIEISTTSDHEQIEIAISDNGIGMSKSTIENLFDIATNTSSLGTSNESGAGLGLVLCKDLVEKIGGKIHVQSTEGIGSSFKITLPKFFPNTTKNPAS